MGDFEALGGVLVQSIDSILVNHLPNQDGHRVLPYWSRYAEAPSGRRLNAVAAKAVKIPCYWHRLH